MTGDENPYRILGLQPSASGGEVKSAYFERVRRHGPERSPEAFKRIRAAYEALKDEKSRAEADLFLLCMEFGPVPEIDLRKELPPAPEIGLDALLGIVDWEIHADRFPGTP